VTRPAGIGPGGIGIVLSSGGIRGIYAHTGFLLALRRLGVPIAAISGCSAGAVVGGIAASGADLEGWSAAIADVPPDRFWRPDPWPKILWRMVARRGRGYIGLADPQPAIDFCRGQLAARTVEDCPVPFRAVALDLARGRRVVFDSGDLATRMVASAAMPLIYRPVAIDGVLYSDGATVELGSTDAICCRFGLEVLIVHHVAVRSPEGAAFTRALARPWSVLEILNRLIYQERPWYLGDAPLTLRDCPCGCGARIIVMEPELPELEWPSTAGGPVIQAAAMDQAEALLRPHLNTLAGAPET
jgi:Patatin-like phospholipase